MLIEKYLHLDELPRMADFASIGSAIAEALGQSKDDFTRAYQSNINLHHDAVLESSFCAQAIIEFMKEKVEWRGTAAELLRELDIVGGLIAVDRRSTSWP